MKWEQEMEVPDEAAAVAKMKRGREMEVPDEAECSAAARMKREREMEVPDEAECSSAARMKREQETEVPDEAECSAVVATGWWNNLPEDFQTEALACLPLHCMERYRKVREEWNTLFSSSYFISRKWDAAPIKNEWLLLYNSQSQSGDCMSFCFYSRTWKAPFSLPELWRYTRDYWRDPWDFHVKYIGSAAGLILANFRRADLNPIVCNPYSKTFIQLPRMVSLRALFFTCIVAGDSNNSYHIVALCHGLLDHWLGDEQLVEIYDSSQKIWKIAGFLPEDIGVVNTVDYRMVFCDGWFYCLGSQVGIHLGILCFTIPSINGHVGPIRALFAPLPELQPHFRVSQTRLLTCGSRLLVAASLFVVETENAGSIEEVEVEGERQVVIWEFQNEHSSSNSNSNSNSNPLPSWKWKEIAMMPSSLSEEYNNRTTDSPAFDCVGVGNHVCIKPCVGADVLAYNVVENSWFWLPTCPVFRFWSHTMSMAFEPRPDMSV